MFFAAVVRREESNRAGAVNKNAGACFVTSAFIKIT